MKKNSAVPVETAATPAPMPRPPKLRQVARPAQSIPSMKDLDRVQELIEENHRLRLQIQELEQALNRVRELAWGTFS